MTLKRPAVAPVIAVLVAAAHAGCGGGGGGANTGGASSSSTQASTGSTMHTSSATGATTSTSSGGTGGATSSSGSGGSSGMTCPPPMKYGGGEMTTSTNSVTARIVDETGAPVAAGQPVYICGLNICSPPGTVSANGVVTISSNLSMKKAAFKVGDTTTYAEIAIPLTMATTDLTAGGTKVINTAKLSDAPGATLTPGMNAVSGDVTLAIPAGATVGIDTIVYSTPQQQQFHAVSIPIANEGPWLAASGTTGFELLYGVSPAETTLCPAAQVTVALPHAMKMPNDLGWAPGAAVEFWMMTVDTGQTYAPYAGWAKMSDGTVSTDGKSITTTQGFIFLQTFAVRLKM